MNNISPRVHINLRRALKTYSQDWTNDLRGEIKKSLIEMNRSFSESDFKAAIKLIDAEQRLNMAGVTFLLNAV
ncbi:MAG: hypothetical protein EOO61_17135 [Hymenobacter sp.]|nr:MAG: hypothetical protein EOO61_17135 [Hymenobacter sp.]